MVYAPDKSLDAGFMTDFGKEVRDAEKKLLQLRYSEAIAIIAMTKDITIMVNPWVVADDLHDTEYLKVLVVGQEDSILLNAAGYKYLMPDGYKKASEWVDSQT